MPEPKYRGNVDMYTAAYEQYYFKNSPYRKVRPIKKVVKKKKNKALMLKNIILFAIFFFMLFYVFPYSYKTFVADVFPQNPRNMLRVDYQKMMFPTYEYLYKDLFLGKYIVKDADFKKPLMVNVKETSQRNGLKNRLLELAGNYKSIEPAVYVWEYNSGTYVDINANEVYPAASIIKLPVLIEMFREIEQGKFSLSDTMVLEDYYRASGSGKLQYSQGGIAHSMDYLAKIMIENSDNSSTNMIMAKMGGMPSVNKAVKSWGLVNTRINNWLPDLDGTNTTTARELGKMLYNIDTTNIISLASKRHIAEYLSHVKNNRLLKAGLPSEAILLHKTGDIGYMLGDAGLVRTSNGRKYIVVILVRRPYNSPKGKEFIVEASKLIYNNISM